MPDERESGSATEAPSATVEVYEDAHGEHRFRVVLADGHVLADAPQGYPAREAVDDAVVRLRAYAPGAPVHTAEAAAADAAGFSLYRAETGEWRWVLRDGRERYSVW